jgi:hypothetical protein
VYKKVCEEKKIREREVSVLSGSDEKGGIAGEGRRVETLRCRKRRCGVGEEDEKREKE